MALNITREANRVAVVTGGASGLGRGYAERLARDGVQVVIADRGPADETVAAILAAGGQARSFETDVTLPGSAERLASEVNHAFGRCDILVNNAGACPFVSFDDMTFDQWRNLMTLNLDAPFLMCKAFVPMMRAAKNTAASSTFRRPNAGPSRPTVPITSHPRWESSA